MLGLLAIPCYLILHFSNNQLSFTDLTALFNEHQVLIIGGIIVWAVLFVLSTRFYEHAKYDMKVNEFGMTNGKDYWHMSDKERREMDQKRQEHMDRVLPQSTIDKATHRGAKNPDAEMQNLYGMETEKNKIKEIVARAKFDKKSGKGKFGSHYVFYGAPGTGKTTFARILTGYLYKNGIIKKNQIIEVDGNTLKGAAPGEGALKAEILVKNAIGGVLFIDEAYSMAEGTFGAEAVSTLIKLMEDRRGDFVLILAGYTKPMAMLLESNPGFRSRIKDYLEFPDYTTEEAVQILEGMAKSEGLTITKSAVEKFKKRYEKEAKKKDFANARTVRNILDEAISSYALRAESGLLASADRAITDADINENIPKNPWD